jgi:hypothetical protein
MELFWNWFMGSVLVGLGCISFGAGSGMMWRAWRAASPPAVIIHEMSLVPSGAAASDGFYYFTNSAGQTYQVKPVHGKKPTLDAGVETATFGSIK